MKTTRKILLSLGVLGATASIAGLGTFATFTDSETVSNTIDSGTVAITLGAAGADNRMAVPASGMVPGDTMQRRVKITNSSAAGAQDLGLVELTTVATTSSVLDTNTSTGLKMKIEKCSLAWVESASAPYTYTCGAADLGTRTTVLAEKAIIGNLVDLSNMTLTTGATNDLVVTITLPDGADNTFQAKSSTIEYTFVATQRAATSK